MRNEKEFSNIPTWKSEGDHIWYFKNNIQWEFWNKNFDYESDSDDESEEEKEQQNIVQKPKKKKWERFYYTLSFTYKF